MDKVKEPNTIEEVWQCPRCQQSYCGDCVSGYEVDFDIEDEPEGFNQKEMQWEGETVCPWCYNQLIDLNLSNERISEKEK